MKTILILAPNIAPYPGGAEIYITSLMKGISHLGWNVICVTENPPDFQLAGLNFIKAEIDIDRLTSKNTVTWREMQFSLLDSMRELEKQKIDIVHANSIEASILGRIVADHLRVPIVATIHEHLSQEKAFQRGRMRLVFERLQLDGFIAPSTFYHKRLLEWNVEKSKIFKVIHGIDFKKRVMMVSDSVAKTEKNSLLRILFVGRIYYPKGLHILIDAIGCMDINMKYIVNIIGPFTDKKYKNDIEVKIKSYKINTRVNFIGSLLQEEVYQYMLNSDILIAPSIYEGFGLSIVEANMLRLPVIASGTGGIVDIIEHKKNGLLFKSEDTEDLKACINYFLNNPKKINEFVENAFQKANDFFTLERMTMDTLKVYEKVIEGYNL